MDGIEATKQIRLFEKARANKSWREQCESEDSANEDDLQHKSHRESKRGRRRNHRMPIVGLTADIQLETHAKCLIADMDAVMTKPAKIPQLLEVIKKFSHQ